MYNWLKKKNSFHISFTIILRYETRQYLIINLITENE